MTDRSSPVSESEKLRLLREAGYNPDEAHPECYRNFSYVKFYELCAGLAQTSKVTAERALGVLKFVFEREEDLSQESIDEIALILDDAGISTLSDTSTDREGNNG